MREGVQRLTLVIVFEDNLAELGTIQSPVLEKNIFAKMIDDLLPRGTSWLHNLRHPWGIRAEAIDKNRIAEE